MESPLALMEFLVAAGIYDYRHGDYWSGVVKRTGLPAVNWQSAWGAIFEAIVAACELEQFDALREEGATRYVPKILAHGGIPNYSLDDFFSRLLVPAVTVGAARDQPPDELIRSWELSNAAFVGVDKPVRRFLVFGGAVAHDFLGRCFEMADLGLRGRPLPGARDLGLPERIVERFGLWLSHRCPGVDGDAPPLPPYVKPIVSYDPWAGDGLDLCLPEEPIREPESRVQWTVSAGAWTRRVDLGRV